MTTLIFKDQDAYEKWTEQFENCSDYEQIPTAIWDGWKMSADLFTECKSYKTALRRFEKAFGSVHPDIKDWVEGMRESCENGYFSDTNGWRPANSYTPEELEEIAKRGTYSWGVEETSEGYWYIFLNISGCYAGVEGERE